MKDFEKNVGSKYQPGKSTYITTMIGFYREYLLDNIYTSKPVQGGCTFK